MISLSLDLPEAGTPRILCLGAHGDDIEIGACATILALADSFPSVAITWVVFGASGNRGVEARESAEHCVSGFEDAIIEIHDYKDGFFPAELPAIKQQFEAIKESCEPDLIFTHYCQDLHQDHRLISELTWQTFRDHLILEYEVPKYDGDLGSPNMFCRVSERLRDEKLLVLDRYFGSQKSKSWFSPDTFLALMRLRGIECNSSTGLAEAFYCRKSVI